MFPFATLGDHGSYWWPEVYRKRRAAKAPGADTGRYGNGEAEKKPQVFSKAAKLLIAMTFAGET
jgi:hypothetical protein